jgi:GTP cyclohydrolase I
VRDIMDHVGEDWRRPGLIDTPRRVREAWEFMCAGYKFTDPVALLRSFTDGADHCEEMVIVTDIPLWSMCEHHMLPFFGVAHVGYLPSDKILGLSKFSRLIEVFARRLQVQERLTGQVAETLMSGLKPLGVGVVLQCRHTCMEARGIQKAGSVTTTTALRGSFKEQPDVRAEFLSRIKP